MTKVLIADDEEAILESTAAVLELFGIAAVTESDAHRIIDRIREEAPDVLLQDVRMPDFDVEAHVRAIRADPAIQHLPIVIFSAYVDATDIARRVGADGAIAKPFEPERLVEIIERAIAAEKNARPAS